MLMVSGGFRTIRKVGNTICDRFINLKRFMRPRDVMSFSWSYGGRVEAKVQVYLLLCSSVLFLLYYDSDYDLNGKELD